MTGTFVYCKYYIYIKIKHKKITDWRHDVHKSSVIYPCQYITLKSCKWNMYTSIFNSNQIYIVKCTHIYIYKWIILQNYFSSKLFWIRVNNSKFFIKVTLSQINNSIYKKLIIYYNIYSNIQLLCK